MEKILSQQEIDAMVRAARGGGKAEAVAPSVVPCDFAQTSLIGGAAMSAITYMHETFARGLTQRMTAFLQTEVTVALVSAESLPFLDYLDRVPDQSYLASVSVMPLAAQAALQIDLGITFALMDSLLGGLGQAEPPGRPISEIEDPILRDLIGLFCQELEGPWKLLPLSFHLENPTLPGDFQRLIPFQERILALSFEIKLNSASGAFSFAFPPVVSGALLRRLSRQIEERRPRKQPGAQARMRRLLRECTFPVDLSLFEVPVTAEDLLELQPGMILPLRYGVDRPATVTTAGTPAFAAHVARRGVHRVAQLQQALGIGTSVEGVQG